MYYSKIKISTEPRVLSFERVIELGYDATLTIPKLIEYGVNNDNSFSVQLNDDGTYSLYIDSTRLETIDEVEKRVKTEIAYNKMQEAFQLKYGRSMT